MVFYISWKYIIKNDFKIKIECFMGKFPAVLQFFSENVQFFQAFMIECYSSSISTGHIWPVRLFSVQCIHRGRGDEHTPRKWSRLATGSSNHFQAYGIHTQDVECLKNHFKLSLQFFFNFLRKFKYKNVSYLLRWDVEYFHFR